VRTLAKICSRKGVCGACEVMRSGLACPGTGTARVASTALGAGMVVGALGATKTSTSVVVYAAVLIILRPCLAVLVECQLRAIASRVARGVAHRAKRQRVLSGGSSKWTACQHVVRTSTRKTRGLLFRGEPRSYKLRGREGGLCWTSMHWDWKLISA